MSKAALLATAGITGFLALPFTASAQSGQAAGPEGSNTVQEVVITGTRIRGIAPIGSNTLNVDRAEIARAPVATASDLLRQLPIATGLGADEGSSNGGTSVQGASFNNTYARAANLRGLGTTATLVLIDGHRIAPQGQTGQINDLDVIPSAAIERIEVVADGASAIYGSDAVAGVINIIPRKRYNGASVTGRVGLAEDYHQWQVSGIVGRTWTGGALTATVEHQYRSRLRASDRPTLYSDDFRAFGGSGPPQLASPGNVLINGVAYAIPTGQSGQGFTLGQLGPAGQPNLTSVWKGVDALPEQKRDTLFAVGNQRLTEWLNLFGEGLYTRRDFDRNNVAAVSSGNGFTVPSSNPFSPCAPGRSTANSQGIACPANGALPVQYSFLNDLGPTYAHGKQETWSLRGGFDVTLPADWKATVAAGYSRSEDVSIVDNNTNATAVTVALTGSASTTVNGVPTTIVRTVPPLNLFCGGVACNDPATLAYISGATIRPAEYKYKYVAVSADGPLFSLPGGAVRAAIGADFRGDTLTNLNRTNTTTPTNQTFVDNLTIGQRTVNSAYAELYVPIFSGQNALPGFKRLDLSAALRVDDYSDFGRTTNPKIGINWQPADDLTLHGSYGTSFRAPTLADINPSAAAVNRSTALTPAQAASLGLGSVSTFNFVSTTGGTIGLKPESASTYSLGADWRPAWLRGFQGSINYYNMVYRNRIDQPVQNVGGINALLGRPLYDSLIVYNPTLFPGRSNISQAEFNAQLQALFNSQAPVFTGAIPNPATVAAITRGNKANTGTLWTSGLDLSASYTFDTGVGTWRVGGVGQYVLTYRNSIVPGQPAQNLVNVFSAVGSPMRFKGRANVGWQRGGWSADAFLNYTNAYTIPRSSIPATAPDRYLTVNAYTTLDASVTYRFGDDAALPFSKGVAVQLSAQNLFNKLPPLMINNGTVPLLFDNSNGSPIGRIVSFQISKTW